MVAIELQDHEEWSAAVVSIEWHAEGEPEAREVVIEDDRMIVPVERVGYVLRLFDDFATFGTGVDESLRDEYRARRRLATRLRRASR